MRYEDASATDSFTADQAATPSILNANSDVDVILAGNYGPATGNAITGTGTISGIAGADLVASGASITAIQGAGGTDTSFSGGKLQVAGEHGVLTIDAQGNYSYVRNQGSPNGVSDVFTYTLAGRDGDTDLATLTINIGKTPLVVQANAVQVVPGPDGVVTLPDGVELSDIHVVGRNLVVELPDGSQMIIVDGAVFVPQLVLGTVEVPSTNLAALLIDSEPTPAAGPPQSSGGNFAVPVAPLDPGEPLGDLLPPTELSFTPPTFEELAQAVEEDEPVLITDLTPSLSGGDVIVDEDDLLASRGAGESAGSDPTQESLTVSGTFTLIAPDGVETLTVGTLNVIVNGNFQAGASMVTPLGNTLTFTGYNAATGVVTYTYTLLDNEAHPNVNGENSLFEEFLVTLTDEDGDVDTDTLSVNVVDDVPTARNDTDAVAVGALIATGNVVTDASPGDAGDSDTDAADTVGADNARVTFIDSADAAPGSNVPNGGFIDIVGQHGTLRIFSTGDYVYTRNPSDRLASSDVFTYTLTDGDGDTSTATLTITLPLINTVPTPFSLEPVGVDEDGLPTANSDDGQINPTEANNGGNATRTGQVVVDFGNDRPADPLGAIEFINVDDLNGQLTQGGDPITFSIDGSGNLIGQVNGTGPAVITIAFISAVNGAGGTVTYSYQVTLGGPVDHDFGDQTEGFVTLENIQAQVTDSNGDQASGSFTGTIWDDVPSAGDPDASELPVLIVDESPVGADEGGDNAPAGVRTASADFSAAFGAPNLGADGLGSVAYALSLSSEGAGSGLYALDATDTEGVIDGIGQGAEILLFTEADGSITGRLTVDGPVYFTISVVETGPGAGTVEFEQSLNVWHANTASDDDTSTLSADAGTITLDQVVTDADGDSDTASVDLSDGVFEIEDDGPVANDPSEPNLPTLVVDESPVGADEGGDNAPAGVRTASADFSAAFGAVNFGTDGAGSVAYALSLSSEGAGSGLYALDATDTEGVIDGIGQGAEILLFTEADGSITGRLTVDGPVYFTISVVETGPGAGTVEFEQSLNVWHANTASDDDTSTLSADAGTITLDQVVTDADGDSDTASVDLSDGVFEIEDDGPVANDPSEPNLPTLVVDESPVGADEGGDNAPAGVRTASADFSAAFGAVNFGTDGAGSVAYALSLSSEGAGSGLYALDATDTEGVIDGIGQGAEILLFTEADGSITGRLTVDGPVYFTLSVVETGPGAGTVEFEQSLNVWHANTASDDDTSTLSADAGTITLDQVVTDADGDSDTASVDLSDGVFEIEDDGPRANNPTGVQLEQLIVDESPLAEDGDNSDSAIFASAFAGFFDHGTDGPGDEQYALILNTEGAASGLFALDPSDTNPAGGLGKGASITLHAVGATVEGRVGGTVYFTISVNADTAEVTLTRNPAVNIWHDDQSNHDDPEVLTALANTLQLQQTVIDADGDTDTAVIDLSSGVFRFEDDGPTADPDTNSVEEGGTLTVNAASGVLADDDFGTDGPGTIQGVAAGSNTGTPVSGNVGSPIVTALGTLTLNANGSYTYVSTDGAVPPGGAQDVFVYTIRDADGDTSTVTLTINLTDDSGPQGGDTLILEVDDDALSDGNNAASDDEVDVGTLTFTAGADALTTFAFAAGTGTLGGALTWNRVNDALIQGWDGPVGTGTLVISLSLSPPAGGSIAAGATGDVTITATLHNNYDSHPVVNLDDLLGLGTVTVRASEADPADFATGTVTLNVSDDVPLNNSATYDVGEVHEDALNTVGAVGNSEGGQTATIQILGASLAGLVSPGADNPVTISLNGATLGQPGSIEGTATGLTQNNISIVWDVVSATEIRGVLSSDPTKVIFTITDNPGNSNYTFTLLDNIDHDSDANLATGHGDAFIETLSLAGVFKAADADNDSVIINAGATLDIENDVPVNLPQAREPVVVLVHEDALNNANADGNSEGGSQTASGTFTVDVLDGADGPVTIGFNADIDGDPTGLAFEGTPILWNIVSGTEIQGVVQGTGHLVFTITAGPGADEYTFTLIDKIDHSPLDAGDADIEALSLAGVFTATDTDGDTIVVGGGITVQIENDVPINNGQTYNVGEVQEDALNNPNAVGNSEGGQSTTIQILGASLAGLVLPGADDPVTISLNGITLGNPGSIEGTATGLFQGGVSITWDVVSATEVRGLVGGDPAKVAFTITDNPGNANFTFTLLDNIDHDSDANLTTGEGETFVETLNLSGVFTATDTDGDDVIIDAGASIDIENDIPVLDAATDAEADAVLPLTWNGTLDFRIGADANTPYSLTSHDIAVALSGTLGEGLLEQTIQNVDVDLVSASATDETFDFSFDYDPNPTDADDTPTETATGTITFDKANGTYTVTLDAPIATFQTINTGNTISKTNYNTVGPSEAQPEIVVSKLADDFFIRFTGAEDDLVSPPVNGAWVAGEEFTGTQGWVSISGTTNGVSSDTLQNSEVLDMDFFTTDPGAVGDTTAATADNVFIKIAQFGTEDLVVILKLVDPDTMAETTRAIVVDTADVWLSSEANPYGITFATGEDGVIIIESNDYNFGIENYQIVGMQLLTSTDGITSAPDAAINLNRDVVDPDTGIGGASVMNDEFDAATDDQDVIKIVDIGFIRIVENTQNIHLDFDVTVTDADGDSFSQQLSINPVDSSFAAFADTSSFSAQSESFALLASDSEEKLVQHQQQKTAANTNTVVLAAAVAAAGMAAEAAANDDNVGDESSTLSPESQPVASVDDSAGSGSEETAQSALGGETGEAVVEESSEAASSSSSSGDQAADGNSLTADNDLSADSQPAQLLEGTEAPASVTVESIVSPVVSMPSAEALIAASLEGGATEGGQSNAVVGQVLVDALEGGGAEASVDALLDALPDQGLGENAAVKALASQPDAAVSAWDMGHSGGLPANANFTMEAMALHHDAVQPVANG